MLKWLSPSLLFCLSTWAAPHPEELEAGFMTPPLPARPGVYWYFMDGNLDRDGMTADLEDMVEAGLGAVLFLEVDVGVPRGPVGFYSEEWQSLFVHAVREAERLGVEIILGTGPGWTGSGGPWVQAEQSMQHLVASEQKVTGPSTFDAVLPLPTPREPFFGNLPDDLMKRREAFYKDVAVLAFPSPEGGAGLAGSDEKSLYYRAPYSSDPSVDPYIPAPAEYHDVEPDHVISQEAIVDLTERLRPGGHLVWEVPAGNWTIIRFGRRNNGANTRPAPESGLGFESDKLDAAALDAHFSVFPGQLLEKIGPRKPGVGLTRLHMDSWEMGSQNWTPGLREAFLQRRGYDPLPYYPAYIGCIVESTEVTERFLWDLRQTVQELIIENHAGHVKEYGKRHGLGLSIEPYDMNPAADLVLGAVADVPMCEFWSEGYGFNTAFSCIEAASIAHTLGRPVVAAESFTATSSEGMRQYPGAMKNQGDWAFCAGVNRFLYHTYAHQPLGRERPGMTMGPYGVHWHRNQTWWPMVSGYHRYVARCSFMLQQGLAVADLLYLTPEGAPHVFRAPASALTGSDVLPDRRGYNFDGCSPEMLALAEVNDRRIVFPSGASYRMLVLPQFETMTPRLLETISNLIRDGAVALGNPPLKSPSLSKYPECDMELRVGAEALWGSLEIPKEITERQFGKGRIYWGSAFGSEAQSGMSLAERSRTLGGPYPDYDATVALLKDIGLDEDFSASGPIRYTHRRTDDYEIYFVANTSDGPVDALCSFRAPAGIPELWDPMTGKVRQLPQYEVVGQQMMVPMRFLTYQSYFVVFRRGALPIEAAPETVNFPVAKEITVLEGPWDVHFDETWGGPGNVTFDSLVDWTERPEPGIRYYSGIATYERHFDVPDLHAMPDGEVSLDLGDVDVMARVRLNGTDLGVVWTPPWQVEVTGILKEQDNHLEIEVANLWANRLIGDQQPGDIEARQVQWSSGLLGGEKIPAGRYTFSTYAYYSAESPLQASGLRGPVRLLRADR